jgi:hypothetical protein
VVKLPLESGHSSLSTVDAVRQMSLMRAVWRGHEKVVTVKLRGNTGICDIPERCGWTLLSWAVEVGDIRIIRPY